jgi:phage/plasmid-associated DNA primase
MPPKIMIKPAAASDHESAESDTDLPINHSFQASHMPEILKLTEFLENAKFIRPAGDRETNIMNRLKGICYCIPDRDIPVFFRRLDTCHRNKKIVVSFSEKQQEYSGIMLDFDIYQDTDKDQVSDEVIQSLCMGIIEKLITLLKFKDDVKKEIVHIGIIRKPKIKPVENTEYFKDGIHLLIPSMQVTRGVKKLLIKKLIDDNVIDQCMADVMPTTHRVKNEPYFRRNFLDQMSSSVPVFLVGCSSKPNTPPYKLSHIYEVVINLETKKNLFKAIPLFETYAAYEFSLNYEMESGKIKKRHYDALECYTTEVATLTTNTQVEEEKIRNFGSLSVHSIHDAARTELKDLLDTLNPARARTYDTWFSVICILASISPSYKDLALYFSANSSKLPQFETYWNQALRGPRNGKKAMGIGTLHYWAKIDNPERFEQLRTSSITVFLNNMIFESFRDGELGHADIAAVLSKLLQHKYITDYPEGERTRKWYEFILENDDKRDGEVFKWRECHGAPDSMNRYISETLPTLLKTVLAGITRQMNDAVGIHAHYLKKIQSNFKRTVRKLSDTGFKRGVLHEAESRFSRIGFAATLDKDPLIRGVANGILKLSITPGGRPLFINSHHTYPVSKFTDVPYIAFNPYDPKTALLLVTLRGMFLDDEPDTFEWLMSYLATTIDGLAKASLFVMMVGAGANGKSALVELLKAAIGQYSVKMPLAYLTSKTVNAENATPVQMMLQYASLAYYSESDKRERLNGARIKEVTGQETIAGRKLRQDMVNFKPRCHHLITTNHDFDINDSGHGLWRRLVYITLKITFVNPNETVYDANNPRQRIANDDISDKWNEDPEIRGRFLGFLVYMHYWLYRRYNGKLANINSPHIKYDTAKYRLRQDTISEFTAARMVKCANNTEYLLVDEIKKYTRWYESYKSEKLPVVGLIEEFQNSIIQKHIQAKARAVVMVGHRFLDEHEKPGPGETYAQREIYAVEPSADNWGIKPETPKDYHARICAEYDNVKHLFPSEGQADVDLDTIQIPINEVKPVAQPPKAQCIEINGNIMPSGIILRKLDEAVTKKPILPYYDDVTLDDTNC